MRKEVVEAVSKIAPIQSKRQSLLVKGPGGCSSRRQNGSVRNPRPQKGRLIQKIQRHVTFWAKAPPIKGPVTDLRSSLRQYCCIRTGIPSQGESRE